MESNHVWLGNLTAAVLATTIMTAHRVRPVNLVQTEPMVITAMMVQEASPDHPVLPPTDRTLHLQFMLNPVKKANVVRREQPEIQETKVFPDNKVETEIPASKVLLVNQAMLVNLAIMATPDQEEILVAMRNKARKALPETLDNVEILVKVVILAPKVSRVILVKPVILVIPDHKDSQVRMASLVNVVNLAKLVNVVHPLT